MQTQPPPPPPPLQPQQPQGRVPDWVHEAQTGTLFGGSSSSADFRAGFAAAVAAIGACSGAGDLGSARSSHQSQPDLGSARSQDHDAQPDLGSAGSQGHGTQPHLGSASSQVPPQGDSTAQPGADSTAQPGAGPKRSARPAPKARPRVPVRWFAVGTQHVVNRATGEPCNGPEQMQRWVERGQFNAQDRTTLAPLHLAQRDLPRASIVVLDCQGFPRGREASLKGHMGTHQGYLEGYLAGDGGSFPALVEQVSG